jgi:8-oxo-dGTP pyrophosphatase MutT (NUDIX family)
VADYSQQIIRHFTATGYVVINESILLHWHSKVKAFLPPGGHIETNEDPVAALHREIAEETGLETVIIPYDPPIDLSYPQQLPPPITIMVEDIDDPQTGYHQHIDMIYFCRGPERPLLLPQGWFLVKQHQLINNEAMPNSLGRITNIPDDVRHLGLRAINLARKTN